MTDLRQNLIERRSIELDVDLAKHYLTYNTYETQRDIREAHVCALADKMKNGLFRFGQIAFVSNNGSRDIMVNGQHVCSAVIKSGETVPCMLEKFKAENDLQLSETYRQFEILPRTIKDMIKVESNALGIRWPVWVSSIIVTAATMEVSGQRKLGTSATPSNVTSKNKFLTKDDKVKLLGKYLKEGSFVANILTFDGSARGPRKAPFLKRAAVILIMMKSWRKDKKDAKLFWERVRDGENLTNTMPEMKIREFLMLTRQASRVAYARTVKPHEYAYKCAAAWNAFRTNNKKASLRYFPDNDIPKLK